MTRSDDTHENAEEKHDAGRDEEWRCVIFAQKMHI